MTNQTSFTPATLIELLAWRSYHQPHQAAYTHLFTGKPVDDTITYGQLDREARHIAVQLINRQAAGERILLLYTTGLPYIAAFFGCLYAGAVAVPTYPPDPLRLKQTLSRFQAVVKDARPTAVLTTSAILSAAQTLFTNYPDLKRMHWIATDEPGEDLSEQWQMPKIGGQSLAFLQYTSGSTAAPKGVMVSHANLLHNLKFIQTGFDLSAASISLTWLPHIHDMGLIDGILEPLYNGCAAYLLSPLTFLQKPFRWLQAISRYRVTHSGGPNFAYELCLRKTTPEQLAEIDLSGWLSAYNGAEPVRTETIRRFTDRFAPAGFKPSFFYPCYGLAEATLMVSGVSMSEEPMLTAFDQAALGQGQVVPLPDSASPSQTLVGCGQVILADTTAVIVNPNTHRRCTPQEIGEVWVSGPGVAQGYWQRPEESQAIFQAFIADTQEGPFMRTGDLGFYHQGQLYIVGRIKDLIIINGRNYYPQDIEQTVEASHPALRPGCAAAFSIDQDHEEQLIVAVEVRDQYQPGKIPDVCAKEIGRAVRQAVTVEHEIFVQEVVLLKTQSIPKTSSGKIQRHACKQGYLADTLALWQPNHQKVAA